MSNRRQATWLAVLATATLGFAATTWAQAASPEPASTLTEAERLERAHELYDNGATLYEEGRYEAAILAFEEAYALTDAPLLLYNIANAYERLGELERVVEYLDRYRAFAPADESESVGQRVHSLERRIEARRSATPEPVGQTEVPREVAPVPSLEPAPESGGIQPIHWALGATAVAGLATGITFAVLSGDSRDAFEAACVDVDGSRVCPDSAGDDYDAWRTQSIVADIGFGIALGATVALILVVVLGDGEEPPAVSVAPWTAPGGAGLSLGGSL